MLTQLAYFQILGKPLIFWSGILALLVLILAAIVPLLNKKGIRAINQKWHKKIGGVALFVAILHGILGLATYI